MKESRVTTKTHQQAKDTHQTAIHTPSHHRQLSHLRSAILLFSPCYILRAGGGCTQALLAPIWIIARKESIARSVAALLTLKERANGPHRHSNFARNRLIAFLETYEYSSENIRQKWYFLQAHSSNNVEQNVETMNTREHPRMLHLAAAHTPDAGGTRAIKAAAKASLHPRRGVPSPTTHFPSSSREHTVKSGGRVGSRYPREHFYGSSATLLGHLPADPLQGSCFQQALLQAEKRTACTPPVPDSKATEVKGQRRTSWYLAQPSLPTIATTRILPRL
ncbi:hypothetical protein E2C01_027226 [Portunus trituberculatus]|uniref:Uncharacterized protein n=1 Tax=Portunus trituberculatus TaxID=210409 RepID=A0A5B7EL35_PORTR|nr:hypothetical protein [Portunus trituberculatus]